MTIGLQMSDDGLNGGAAAQLALDEAEDAALLAGDEDPTGILCVVAAVSLVDIGALDRTAGERLGAVDDVPQGMTVVGIIGQRPARTCSSQGQPGSAKAGLGAPSATRPAA